MFAMTCHGRRDILVMVGDVVAVHKDGDVVKGVVIVKDVAQIDARFAT